MSILIGEVKWVSYSCYKEVHEQKAVFLLSVMYEGHWRWVCTTKTNLDLKTSKSSKPVKHVKKGASIPLGRGKTPPLLKPTLLQVRLSWMTSSAVGWEHTQPSSVDAAWLQVQPCWWAGESLEARLSPVSSSHTLFFTLCLWFGLL